MNLNRRLLEILQCPRCSGHRLLERGANLICNSCGASYGVVRGIPDMRVYKSCSYSDDFNEGQARYEARVHDTEAIGSYERKVIQVFGTKTRLLVQDWGDSVDEMVEPVVLDYGCGTGQVSRVLSHRLSPLFAFDISRVSMEKNVRDNGVVGLLANALFLPFRDMTFDLICINGVLHHIVDLGRAVEEIARVAKGRVYISEGIPRGPPSFRRILSYPLPRQRVLYALYLMVFTVRKLANYTIRALRKALFPKSRESLSPGGGSKYERPLPAGTVEMLLMERGFRRRCLRYFTNIDLRGDGALKEALTRKLVSDVTGTHFDLQMERAGGP